MTHLPALVHLLGAAAKKTTNPLLTLLPLILIVVAGYFFFLKPQQRKAAAARANAATPYEVGDEVQTIGGVVGTILEIHGDRYTLLTGHHRGRRQSRGSPADADRLRPPGHRPKGRPHRRCPCRCRRQPALFGG